MLAIIITIAAAAIVVKETKWAVQVYTAHEPEPGLPDTKVYDLSVHSPHIEAPHITGKSTASWD